MHTMLLNAFLEFDGRNGVKNISKKIGSCERSSNVMRQFFFYWIEQAEILS